MEINKIKDSFNRYNSWVKKYENERQEAQKNYTPEAFYKWNSEAEKRLKSTAAAFISELKENSKQELETLKMDSLRKVGFLDENVVKFLSAFDDLSSDELSHLAATVSKDAATQEYIAQYAAKRNTAYNKPITAKAKYEAANRLFNSAEWIIDNAATDRNARAQLKQFCTDSGFNAFTAEAAKVIDAE